MSNYRWHGRLVAMDLAAHLQRPLCSPSLINGAESIARARIRASALFLSSLRFARWAVVLLVDAWRTLIYSLGGCIDLLAGG